MVCSKYYLLYCTIICIFQNITLITASHRHASHRRHTCQRRASSIGRTPSTRASRTTHVRRRRRRRYHGHCRARDVVRTMRPPTLPGSDCPPEPATACPRRPCRPIASSLECGGNRPPWAANNMTSYVRKFFAGQCRPDGQPVTPNLTSKKPRAEGHCDMVQRPACR